MLRLTSGSPATVRVRALMGGITSGSAFNAVLKTANCEVAARTAERLGLGPGVARPLYEIFERWDGRGQPTGLAGEGLPSPLGWRTSCTARCSLKRSVAQNWVTLSSGTAQGAGS
jgi:hypothetical protein